MKRSSRASLVLLGSAPFWMLACEKQEPGVIYRTAEECKRAGHLAPEECERAFEWASDESERIAPRYAQESDCEADFGAFGCHPNGPYFQPRMAGMLARSILTSGRDSTALRNPQPLFESTRERGMLRTAGNVAVGRQTGALDVEAPAFRPIQRAQVISRGGFGPEAMDSRWVGG